MSAAPSFSEQISLLLRTGRATQAVQLTETMLKKSPRDARLWLVLAQVHGKGTRRYDQTLKAAKKATKLAPKSYLGWLEAAQALDRLERYVDAQVHIDKARKLAPNNPDVRFSSALILANLGDAPKAIAQLQHLLTLAPNHSQAKIQLADLLIRDGKPDEARIVMTEMRQTDPDNPRIYSMLGSAQTWAAGDPALAYLEDQLIPKAKAENSPHLPELIKTLAKAKNDLKEYSSAFTLWGKAKTVEGRTHDAVRYNRFVDTLIKSVSSTDYFGNPGSPDETPVLIVGMPRSGTTLLAQILSAHPEVASVGESPAMRTVARQHRIALHDAQSQLALLKSHTKDTRAAFADTYLSQIKRNHKDAKRIVDKRPHNFEYLGLIAAAMPKARIIHAVRDPLDTCVSCYMQKLQIEHGYTGDLAQLGEYYTHYRKLMDHWTKILPNPILTVNYEEVVADTEGQARHIIDFLGLEWDAACLSFQDNDTQVRTLSNWQVRQPIYSTSVQRWRRYDEHLGPLKAALASFYPDGLG